ncbi:MAG: hypothetical protein SV375_05525 [Thermodesulfobacteriota bacterium]|nr:hypothetical protein [Thermodesulfobacteriota bacterium]
MRCVSYDKEALTVKLPTLTHEYIRARIRGIVTLFEKTPLNQVLEDSKYKNIANWHFKQLKLFALFNPANGDLLINKREVFLEINKDKIYLDFKDRIFD